MASKNVAIPYALALLEVATDAGALPAVRKELSAFAGLVEASEELRIVLTNPTVDAVTRKAIVGAMAKRGRYSKLTTNFLSLLADKRRLNAIGDIASEFTRRADKRSGILHGTVETAVQLSPAQRTQLKSAVEKLTGKKVQLEESVNPTLIGGMRLRVEGQLYDSSLRTHFENVRDTILQEI